MSETIIFKLKEPQKGVPPSQQKETLVYLFFNFGYSYIDLNSNRKYKPLKYSTGLKIKPCDWVDKPTYRARETDAFTYLDFNAQLNSLSNTIRSIYNATKNPDPDKLRDILDVELRKTGMLPKKKMDINTYMDIFISDCIQGKRFTEKRTRYAHSSIKSLRAFKRQFDLFQKEQGLTLNFYKIDFDFYNKFLNFFYEKNYSPNTIGKYIKHLKTFMRASKDEGLHNNSIFESRRFGAPRSDVFNIYLNDDELERMFDLDLSGQPHLDVARNVFLIGCYTAQRYSDYSRIKRENINNGYVIMNQKKTGARVMIPIKHELGILLEQYDNEVPQTHEQKLNKYIKEVGKLAGIDEPIIVDTFKGGIRKEEVIPKYKLIKTHTARRSGCTNMFEAGIPPTLIMKISGHKSEKEFFNYIKISEKQAAEAIASHPYFN